MIRTRRGSLAVACALALTCGLMPGLATADELGTAAITPTDETALVAQANANVVTITVEGYKDSRIGYEMLSYYNAERANRGMKRLGWDSRLEEAATIRAFEFMLKQTHERPNGSSHESIWPTGGGMGFTELLTWESSSPTAKELFDSMTSFEATRTPHIYHPDMIGFAAVVIKNPVDNKYYCCITAEGNRTPDNLGTGSIGTVRRSIVVNLANIGMSLDQVKKTVKVVDVSDGVNTSTSVDAGPASTDSGTGSDTGTGTGGGTTGGGTTGGGTVVSGPVSSTIPLENGWQRLAGAGRYQTMAEIAKQTFSRSDVAVVACGTDFPDALAASSVAGAYDAPIILTERGRLTPEADSELSRLGTKRALVIGGAASVNDQVASAITAKGIEVTRIQGADRSKTSIEIAKHLHAKGILSEAIIIANGHTFADALSIGPWAYATESPIVLTGADGTLSADAVAAIKSIAKIKHIVLVGGAASVSDACMTQLGNTYNYTRLGGANRFETSAGVAAFEATHGLTFQTSAAANGFDFPDALAGAPLVGSKRGILVLVHPTSVATYMQLGTHAFEIDRGYVLGGISSVSIEAFNNLPPIR